MDHTECWAEQQSRHAYLLVVPGVVVVLYQQSIHISHSHGSIQRLLVEKGTALTHTLLRVLLVEAAGEEENTRPLIIVRTRVYGMSTVQVCVSYKGTISMYEDIVGLGRRVFLFNTHL